MRYFEIEARNIPRRLDYLSTRSLQENVLSTKKLIVIAAAVFLLPMLMIGVGVFAFFPELQKFYTTAMNSYSQEDLKELRTLETSMFKCSYPANWILTERQALQHTEHDLRAFGGGFIYIYEFPAWSKEDPDRLAKSIASGLKSMSHSVEEQDITKWGHCKGTGHRMSARIFTQSFTIQWLRMPCGSDGAEVMVLQYRSIRDSKRRGFDIVERTFELKPQPEKAVE